METSADGMPRVSRALRERVLGEARADIMYRRERHVVNRARFDAYQAELEEARLRGDWQRATIIVSRMRRLTAASHALLDEIAAITERLTWWKVARALPAE